MRTNILFAFLLLACFANAQSPSRGYDTESVIVHKDPRFDELAAKQAELNKHAYKSGPHRISGFRVQAANTQNRDEANAVKAEMLRRFADQKSYLLYQAPTFRVRVGDFRTQKEAFQLRKLISALYPNHGIYIVPDVIEYTPPADSDDDEK